MNDKRFVYQLIPGEFEEVVEEVFKRQGFQTRLTPQTRDGGKDIIATKSILGRPVMFLIECKRYNEMNKIGVDIVRALYGVQTAERANKAIIVTSSYFTEDAQRFAEQQKTMIDLFKGAVEAGYYDQSQKIVRILLSVVTSLGIVMLPRIANLFSKDDLNEVKKSLRKAFVVISFLSIPITFGLIGISDKFVPILFGNEFLSVIPLTKISPVLVIIIGLGNVFGTQYLLAIGKNKEYTASVCIGALVNFCFNLLLIPRFAAMGAVIATVSAELSIALIQFWFARVVFDFTWIKETYKYWVSGILMLAIVRLVGNVTPISILFLVLQIAIGSLVYFISLIILRDKFLFEAIENVIDRIRKR